MFFTNAHQTAQELAEKFNATSHKRMEVEVGWLPRFPWTQASLRTELKRLIEGDLSIIINHRTKTVVIERLGMPTTTV